MNYTTLVLIHGFVWHGGIFVKLLPLAPRRNTRVVIVNRRDYPGAAPYTPEEQRVLEEANNLVQTGTDTGLSKARAKLEAFFAERGRELYDLLVDLVKENGVPAACPAENTGGIILAGWSSACAWMTTFLANVSSFPVKDVDLSLYVRRVIYHDAPYEILGYPPPDADPYSPLFDPNIPQAEKGNAFNNWVSGYFQHGFDSDTDEAVCNPAHLSRRTSLAQPPTTFSTLSQAERAAAIYPPPGEPAGSDILIYNAFPSGAYAAMHKRALAPTHTSRLKEERGALIPELQPQEKTTGDNWRKVELRMVWCDRSIWTIPWAIACVKKELDEAKLAGKPLRRISFLRIRGANHFVHWDEPEKAMDAFLSTKGGTDD